MRRRPTRRERREVREQKYLIVTDIRRNPSYPGAVLLTTEPCPNCGAQHQHGNPRLDTDNDGTYGHRTSQCPDIENPGDPELEAKGYMLVPDRNPLTIEGLE